MSPLNTDAPPPSLISTLCGTASLFSKLMTNAVSAGALTSVCSKAMPTAEMLTLSPAPAPSLGAAEAPAEGAASEGAASEGAADPSAEAAALGATVGGAYVQPGAEEDVHAPSARAVAAIVRARSERRMGTTGG